MRKIPLVTFAQMLLFLVTQYVGLFTIWTAMLNPASSFFSFIATVEPIVNYLQILAGFTVVLFLGTAFMPQRFGLRRWSPAMYRVLTVESAIFCASTALWVLVSAAGLPSLLAVAVGISIAVWQLKYSSVVSDNLVAIFLNAGAAVLIVYAGLMISFFYDIQASAVSAVIIPGVLAAMALIAVEDYLAVRSGRMISIVKFTLQAKAFTGLKISRDHEGSAPDEFTDKTTGRGLSIIGAGDIISPLIFTSAVRSVYGLPEALVVPLFATAGLTALMTAGRRGRAYPAMPAITAGCFIAWLVLLLITHLAS